MELPAGYIDMVTQEVMRDPIMASDGYSYGRISLRNMFLMEARRFADQGRPAGRPPRLLSLKDPSVELKNPFSDIPDWPASFTLFRNHDLRHSIDEWLLEHGLPANQTDNEEEKEREEKESEPVYSRRDGDGFQYGIFFGAPEDDDEAKDDDDEDDAYVESNSDVARRFEFEFGDIARRRKLHELREDLFPSVFHRNGTIKHISFQRFVRLLAYFIVEGDERLRLQVRCLAEALAVIRERVSAVDPAIRFNTLLHLIQAAVLRLQHRRSKTIRPQDVLPVVENHVV